MLLVRVVGGAPLPRWTYAVPPLVGALLWPLLSVLLQWPQRPARSPASARRRTPIAMARRLFTRSDDYGGGRGFGASELRNAERELLPVPPPARRRRRAGRCSRSSGCSARFFYLQVVAARALPDARRDEPHRDRADRAQPRRDHRPQRRRARAKLLGVHARDHARARSTNLDATIDALAEIVDVQPRDRKRFRKLLEESKNFESLPLRTRLTDEEVARFAVNRYRFPGVEIKARLFRQYPYGEVASHVVGYIGRINDRDVERIDEWDETANYKGSDYIGKVGVELSYERELHGTTGVEEVEVDAGGRAVRTLSRTPPASGNNLALSLDIKLQEVAEAAFGDRRGALVAIDPDDRRHPRVRVASPASIPTSSSTASTPPNWAALNESPDKPLLNRPLRGAYPPGSTIKPFLALAALTSGKRTPQQTIFDPGFFQLPGQRAPLPRRQARRPRHGRHVQVDRRVLRHVLLHARERDRHRRHARASCRSSASAARPASTSKAS